MKATILMIAFMMFTSIAILAEESNPAEPNSAPALTNTISGIVIDKTTGEVLTGVEVNVEGTELKAYTDFDGKFVFEGVSAGEYKVSAKLISYNNGESLAIKLKSNELHALNLQLENVRK